MVFYVVHILWFLIDLSCIPYIGDLFMHFVGNSELQGRIIIVSP